MQAILSPVLVLLPKVGKLQAIQMPLLCISLTAEALTVINFVLPLSVSSRTEYQLSINFLSLNYGSLFLLINKRRTLTTNIK